MRLGATVAGYPFASELYTDLLRQFQYIGLLLCCAGPTKEALDRVGGRHLGALSWLEAAKTVSGLPVMITGIPVVYNSNSWHSERLCGYAGPDFQVDARDVLASYTSAWLAQVHEAGAGGHFLRNLLWFYAERGDVASAIAFALDLFRAGFIITPRRFCDLLWDFLQYYAADVDVSWLKGTGMADRPRINDQLKRIQTSSRGNPVSQERVHEILDLLIDDVVDRMEEARAAPTIDEWLIRLSQLWGPVSALSILFHPVHREGLTPVQKAILSQVEETSADLGATFGELRIFADYQLPLVWTLHAVRGVGEEYEARYGDGWLEKLAGDRLLMPSAVVEALLARGNGISRSATAIPVPAGWELCSDLAAPLCCAYGRDPWSARTEDYPAEELWSMCLRLGWSPQPGGAGPGKRPPDELLIEARRQLAAAELYLMTDYLAKAPNPTDLPNILASHPWNDMARRRYGSQLLHQGEEEAARSEIRQALLLDPISPENWEAGGRVCSERERPLFEAAVRELNTRIEGARAKLKEMGK